MTEPTLAQTVFKIIKVRNGVAFVNRGSDDGLTEGDILIAKRLDGHNLVVIGSVIVLKVTPSRSAVKLTNKDGRNTLKVEDLIFKTEEIHKQSAAIKKGRSKWPYILGGTAIVGGIIYYVNRSQQENTKGTIVIDISKEF